MEGRPQPALEALFADQGWVHRLARSLVADPGAAEDVVQETWIAALDRPGDGPPPRSWLARVARNFALQRARSEAARSGREERAARGEAVPSSAELVERMERQRLLAAAITRLPEPYRSTVLLRYSEDLAPAEIARLLGVPPGTVRRRLKEALERLRADLDRRFGTRHAWVVALRPFVESRRALAASTPATGALLVMKAVLSLSLLAAGAAGALLLLDDERDGGPAGGDTLALDASASPVPADLSGDGTAAAAPAAGRDAAATRAAVATDAPERLRGRVLLPPGAPLDDTLEVLLLAEPLDYAELVRRLEGRGAGVAARADVDPDGAFALELPDALPQETVQHVALRGRYLYAGAQPVERDGRDVELVPRRGAWVTGRVVVSGAEPAAGVPVRLLELPELAPTAAMAGQGFEARGRSAADGAFEFRGVPVAGDHACVAVPERWGAARVDLSELAPLARHEMEVRVAPGGSVAGRVVDVDGEPVEGAAVEATLPGRLFGFDDLTVRAASTAADGRFRLPQVPAAELFLVARAPGRLDSASRRVRAAAGVESDAGTLALGRGVELAGRIRWSDGSPAAGVEVRATFDEAFAHGADHFRALRGARGAARTDAAGAFRLSGLGQGPFVVTAEAHRPAGAGVLVAQLDGVRPADAPLELVLRPRQTLAGRVVTASGAPVREYRLRAARVVDGALGEMSFERRERAFRTEDGAFQWAGFAPGVWLVSASGEGLHTPEAVRVELPGEGAPVVVSVARAAVVRGTVRSWTGEPAAGATVRVVGERPAWTTPVLAQPPPASTVTDEAGAFELGGVGAGDVAMVADSAGSAPSDPARLSVAEGHEVAGVELVLRPGGTLLGRVGSDEEPGAGQLVHLEHTGSGATRLARTDVDGRFASEHLEAGTWGVAAVDAEASAELTSEDVMPGELAVLLEYTVATVEDGGVTEVVLGASAEAPVTVFGTVSHGGEPRARTAVTFLPAGGGSFGDMVFGSTDAEGGYEVELAGAGSYSIAIPRFEDRPNETVDFVRDVPGGVDRYRLDLAVPAGGIAGRVFGPGGEPAERVRVTALSRGRAEGGEYTSGVFTETLTDAEGRYEVPALRPGSYALAAGGASLDPRRPVRALARTYRDGVEVRGDRWQRDVDFHLEEGRSAAVTVVDPAGTPVSGATVFARGPHGAVVDPVSAARTDAAGRCTYAGLGPGEHTFFARTWERASAPAAAVSSGDGAQPAVELVLRPASRLRVHLVDEAGRPLRGWFELHDADGHQVGGAYPLSEVLRFLGAGGFSPTAPLFGPLPPGEYRVEAESADGRRATRTVMTVEDGGEVEVVLRVRR